MIKGLVCIGFARERVAGVAIMDAVQQVGQAGLLAGKSPA